MSASILTIPQVNASDSVTTDNLTAEDTITTKNLTVTGGITLAGTQILTQTDADLLRPLTVIFSDGSEGTLTATVHSKVCNINDEQHLLTCQLDLKGLTKSIKEMIIPTGLDFTGRQTKSTSATVAEINGTDLLLGLVHIYVENGFLMAKVVFSETPSYTSMLIRINIVFN